jgi:ribonuclease HII
VGKGSAVAGVDEVGVAALGGPVVAAAVILVPGTTIVGVADSKLLSPKRRMKLFAVISESRWRSASVARMRRKWIG